MSTHQWNGPSCARGARLERRGCTRGRRGARAGVRRCRAARRRCARDLVVGRLVEARPRVGQRDPQRERRRRRDRRPARRPSPSSVTTCCRSSLEHRPRAKRASRCSRARRHVIERDELRVRDARSTRRPACRGSRTPARTRSPAQGGTARGRAARARRRRLDVEGERAEIGVVRGGEHDDFVRAARRRRRRSGTCSARRARASPACRARRDRCARPRAASRARCRHRTGTSRRSVATALA